MPVIESFPPIENADCRILILGSMPGVMSLAQQQYYAHPRNAFWPIMSELLALDPGSDYATKTAELATAGIALWDVLQACVRTGSLDSAIETASIVPNDIAAFLKKHRALQRICFNGAKAAQLFRRHVQPTLTDASADIDYFYLPSTSPAHAGMPYAEKLQHWRAALGKLEN